MLICLECGHEMKRLPPKHQCPKCKSTDLDLAP